MTRNWQDISPTLPQEGSNLYWYMSHEEFQRAIEWLQREEKLKLPYGLFPGSYPGGIVQAVGTSWHQWKRYQWNFPEFRPDLLEDDERASPKPSWKDLKEAAEKEGLRLARGRILSELDFEATRRITEAYGESRFEKEVQVRLRGDSPVGADAERDRLRGRFQVLKAWVGSSSREVGELEGFVAGEDRYWANPPEEP